MASVENFEVYEADLLLDVEELAGSAVFEHLLEFVIKTASALGTLNDWTQERKRDLSKVYVFAHLRNFTWYVEGLCLLCYARVRGALSKQALTVRLRASDPICHTTALSGAKAL